MKSATIRTITIIVKEGNDFDIHEGENYVTRLCWDEMLGSIAEITHPAIGRSRYPMLSPEQHIAREEARRARLNSINLIDPQGESQ